MGKPQQKKRNRQPRPSWFQKQIEKNGPDFLDRKNPMDIQRESMNIIRDIIRGNITPNDYPYLFTVKVIENVNKVVFEKASELKYISDLSSFVNMTPNSVITFQNMYGTNIEYMNTYSDKFRTQFNIYNALYCELTVLLQFISLINPKTEEDYNQAYHSMYYRLSNIKNIGYYI